MSAVDTFAGMKLRCSGCPEETVPSGGRGESVKVVKSLTEPKRNPDDPQSVVRCSECGKRHSTDSLEYVGDA